MESQAGLIVRSGVCISQSVYGLTGLGPQHQLADAGKILSGLIAETPGEYKTRKWEWIQQGNCGHFPLGLLLPVGSMRACWALIVALKNNNNSFYNPFLKRETH